MTKFETTLLYILGCILLTLILIFITKAKQAVSSDYRKGFKDGAEFAIEEMNKAITKAFISQSGGSNGNANGKVSQEHK